MTIKEKAKEAADFFVKEYNLSHEEVNRLVNVFVDEAEMLMIEYGQVAESADFYNRFKEWINN